MNHNKFEIEITASNDSEMALTIYMMSHKRGPIERLVSDHKITVNLTAYGEHRRRLMLRFVCSADSETACAIAYMTTVNLSGAGVRVLRTVVRTLCVGPPLLPERPFRDTQYYMYSAEYTVYSLEQWEVLAAAFASYGAHTFIESRVGHSRDTKNITIYCQMREYGPLCDLLGRIARLVPPVGIKCSRSGTEYCVYDDAPELDRGWLSLADIRAPKMTLGDPEKACAGPFD